MGEEMTRSEPVSSDDEEVKLKLKKEKKSRKSKKEKKKSKGKEKHDEENSSKGVESDQESPNLEKKQKKNNTSTENEDRQRKREEKKQKKKEILAQIPKRDADGISYTKIQIRRMVRRVQRGLPPVPTPQEEAELKRQDAELRKEEEMELAGMIYNRDDEEDQQEDDGEDSDGEGEGDDDQVEREEGNKEQSDDEKEDAPSKKKEDEADAKFDKETQPAPTKKRKLSKKPVPPDYVCQACKNKHGFPHWIYDCPDKVTVRGTNQVAAGRDGNNAPSAKKVFVSGLFFDSKPKDVKAIFQSCGKVTSCKLLTFPDTGRCKGQAFLVFDTEESAKKALRLSGTKIEADNSGKDKKGKSPVKRELELKVSKVMSRAFTKGKH